MHILLEQDTIQASYTWPPTAQVVCDKWIVQCEPEAMA